MPADNVPGGYHWVPMYLSPENDFLGYHGSRMIGRVRRDGRPQFAGTWSWSNAIGSNMSQYDIQHGYAASKELAILATEDHDRTVNRQRDAPVSFPLREAM